MISHYAYAAIITLRFCFIMMLLSMLLLRHTIAAMLRDTMLLPVILITAIDAAIFRHARFHFSHYATSLIFVYFSYADRATDIYVSPRLMPPRR